jgi:hypothetical protein
VAKHLNTPALSLVVGSGGETPVSPATYSKPENDGGRLGCYRNALLPLKPRSQAGMMEILDGLGWGHLCVAKEILSLPRARQEQSIKRVRNMADAQCISKLGKNRMYTGGSHVRSPQRGPS